MTLLDFGRLLRHHLKAEILIFVVCALACLGVFAAGFSNDAIYEARSRIVVSSHVQDVGGLAAVHARALTGNGSGAEVKSTIDSWNMTVIIAATSSDENASIELANSTAEAVLKEAFEFIPASAEEPFNARVELADKAVGDWSETVVKRLLIAVLLGLFVAVCYALVAYWRKRPVIGIESVMGITDLPVLESFPVTDGGERLLANIRFVAKSDDVKSISLVPVGESAMVSKVAETLGETAQKESDRELDVFCRESLSRNISAAYESRKDDVAVLVVTQWKDSLPALEDASAELKLAGANLIGSVFVKSR